MKEDNDNHPPPNGALKAHSIGVGATFGLLTVADVTMNVPGSRYVLCKCSCGTEKLIRVYNLLKGESSSCGCQKTAGMQAARRKTGARRSADPALRKFYAAWSGMRARCNNPNHKDYKYYGALGVQVCERWASFENFKADMWPRPDGKTLDRKDPTKGYSPDNCRWATHIEQRHNRRAA